MRVYELAQELSINDQLLLTYCKRAGVAVERPDQPNVRRPPNRQAEPWAEVTAVAARGSSHQGADTSRIRADHRAQLLLRRKIRQISRQLRAEALRRSVQRDLKSSIERAHKLFVCCRHRPAPWQNREPRTKC